jgi:hypothetical protein
MHLLLAFISFIQHENAIYFIFYTSFQLDSSMPLLYLDEKREILISLSLKFYFATLQVRMLIMAQAWKLVCSFIS